MATGLIFDESMSEYHCLWDPTYVEKPERFTRVLERCRELGLVERCVNLKPRKATEQELLTTHSKELIQFMKETEKETDADVLKKYSSRYDCIYIHPNSYSLACLCSGSAIELTDAVMTGKLRNGFGILRPPGHHAMVNDICGYCYFNNVVIAARHALNKGTKRILIVDWDVHHGQGTQRAFYDDPRVLYFSIHRYEFGTWWPELRESDFDHIGTGPGRGFNINIPLNKIGNTDSDYLAAFLEVLMPVANEFDPELVLVSAGYDPALGCIEGEQEVTPACFSHFTNLVSSLANGKVIALLEGGYCLTSLAEGAALTVKTLLGDPCPKLSQPVSKPCKEMREAINNVKIELRPFWKCLQVEDHDPSIESSTKWLGPTGPPPTEYDPMCPTPLRPDEVEQEYERRLKKLQDETDLRFATAKLSICSNEEAFVSNLLWQLEGQEDLEVLDVIPALVEQVEWLNIHGFALQKKEKELRNIGIISQVLDSVLNQKSQSGIALIDPEVNFNALELSSFIAKEKHKADRILQISFNDGICFPKKRLAAERGLVLNVEVGATEEVFKKHDIALKLAAGEDNQDAVIISLLLRILLPIGYSFLPDLVLVHSSLSSSLLSSETFSLASLLLSGLSNGKMVHIMEGGSGPFDNPVRAARTVEVLMKRAFKSPGELDFDKSENSEEIERARKALKNHWEVLED